MAFREVRDPETGELVIKYDAETDRVQYRDQRRQTRIVDLGPYREAVKERVDDPRRPEVK